MPCGGDAARGVAARPDRAPTGDSVEYSVLDCENRGRVRRCKRKRYDVNRYLSFDAPASGRTGRRVCGVNNMANAFVMVRFKGTRRLPERSAEPPREDLAFVRLYSRVSGTGFASVSRSSCVSTRNSNRSRSQSRSVRHT